MTPYSLPGMRFLGKSKSGYRNPKTDCAFFGATPKMDHETIKFTLWMDYSDHFQIQHVEIHNFEIHNLSVFFGTGYEKSVFDKRFSEQKCMTF